MSSTSFPDRDYGHLYTATKGMTVKEVAAHMRKVIRQAAKDGILPTDWNYSVRYESYTGGTSIEVNVGIPDDLHTLRDAFETEHGHRYYTFTDLWTGKYAPLSTLHAGEQLLTEIHAGYNYDGSDSMTDYYDVRYYGTVRLMSNTWYGRFYGKVKA